MGYEYIRFRRIASVFNKCDIQNDKLFASVKPASTVIEVSQLSLTRTDLIDFARSFRRRTNGSTKLAQSAVATVICTRPTVL